MAGPLASEIGEPGQGDQPPHSAGQGPPKPPPGQVKKALRHARKIPCLTCTHHPPLVGGCSSKGCKK